MYMYIYIYIYLGTILRNLGTILLNCLKRDSHNPLKSCKLATGSQPGSPCPGWPGCPAYSLENVFPSILGLVEQSARLMRLPGWPG